MAILSNIQQRFYLVFLRNEFNKAAVHRNYSKKFEDIPGPYSLPAVGTLYQYLPAIGNPGCNATY